MVKRIRKLLQHKKEVKIITLVRDPIAKTVSQLFQTPESFKLDEATLLEMDANDICELLIGRYQDRFREPLKWFDEEFKRFTGIDVYSVPFDHLSRCEKLKSDCFDILVLRMEDLFCEKLIVNHLSELTNRSITKLISANQTMNKQSASQYMKVKRSIKLSESFLNEIYSSQYCQHFYTEIEIKTFKEYWRSENI